jgi:hypothetical protein
VAIWHVFGIPFEMAMNPNSMSSTCTNLIFHLVLRHIKWHAKYMSSINVVFHELILHQKVSYLWILLLQIDELPDVASAIIILEIKPSVQISNIVCAHAEERVDGVCAYIRINVFHIKLAVSWPISSPRAIIANIQS